MRPRSGKAWTVRAVALALAFALLLGLLGLLVRAGSGGAGTPVASSEAFLASVGVQTHGPYFDTAYADADRVIRAVHRIGFRHVRDGVRTGPRNEATVRYLERLGATGVRLDLGPDVPLGDNA